MSHGATAHNTRARPIPSATPPQNPILSARGHTQTHLHTYFVPDDMALALESMSSQKPVNVTLTWVFFFFFSSFSSSLAAIK